MFCLGSCGLCFGVEELPASRKGIFGRADNSMIWNQSASCGVFGVRECSEFTGREKSVPDLKLSLVKSLFEWMNAFPLFSSANKF